jgi:hypothetical protein
MGWPVVSLRWSHLGSRSEIRSMPPRLKLDRNWSLSPRAHKICQELAQGLFAGDLARGSSEEEARARIASVLPVLEECAVTKARAEARERVLGGLADLMVTAGMENVNAQHGVNTHTAAHHRRALRQVARKLRAEERPARVAPRSPRPPSRRLPASLCLPTRAQTRRPAPRRRHRRAACRARSPARRSSADDGEPDHVAAPLGSAA